MAKKKVAKKKRIRKKSSKQRTKVDVKKIFRDPMLIK